MLLIFQMKFNKILDVTESESPLVQTTSEREANQMLQYDESDLAHHEDDSNSEDEYNDEEGELDFQEQLEYDLAMIHPESAEILDDWKCAEIKVDEIVSDPNAVELRHHNLSPADSDSSIDSFFKPEADQNVQLLSDDALTAMRRNNLDYITIAARLNDE